MVNERINFSFQPELKHCNNLVRLSLAHQVEGVVGSSGRSALDTGFTLAEADLLQRAQEVGFKI